MRRDRRPPLSPRGTASQRFVELRGERAGDSGELGEFFRRLSRGARAHDLGDDSLYLAEEVVGLARYMGPRERRALALALLASMIAARAGCTRLPLGGGRTGYLGRIVEALLREAGPGLGPELDAARVTADIDALTRSTTFDRLIGDHREQRPLLVFDDCLYQHRMLACERALVDRLRERLQATARPLADETEIDAAIAAVAASSPLPLSEEQLAAVRGALTRPLAVITGGPGTGKTAIVMAILRVAQKLGIAASEIRLAAPTGKAVNRMAGSIAAGIEPPAGESADGPEPETVHRLLGWSPRMRGFRHHENNRLRARLVILDEASMIDLALMERVLAAVGPETGLVLLGDADQLPSVDAGAVLRDLVVALPAATNRLTRSYRMNPSDPAGREILLAARAVNAGEPPQLSGQAGAVRLVDTGSSAARVADFVDRWYHDTIAGDEQLAAARGRVFRQRDGMIVADQAESVQRLLASFDHRRLLTVTRRQPTGSEAINRALHQRVLDSVEVDRAPELYPGEPVLMRSNDYDRGLFNGDHGVILRVADARGRQHHYRAVFPTREGYRVFDLDALRSQLELGYAMTVHKSQGSEFDHVALILPTRDLPLLSRELLYTAITRARRSVTLVGSKPLLRIAANRSTERLSGVADAIAG